MKRHDEKASVLSSFYLVTAYASVNSVNESRPGSLTTCPPNVFTKPRPAARSLHDLALAICHASHIPQPYTQVDTDRRTMPPTLVAKAWYELHVST